MNPDASAPSAGADDHAEELAFARRVLSVEAAAIEAIPLGASFPRAVERIARAASAGGAAVVGGLGKSGLIGQKISATLASTGTPSHFLHPVEAVHGDLGRVRREDVMILASFGGATEEVVELAAILRQDGVPVIALTRSAKTELGRLAEVTLPLGEPEEACPHNLAPTASTAATLALGDALALAVSRRRSFGVADFQRVHPGGSLGRALKSVSSAMRFRAGENLPLIPHSVTVAEAYAEAARGADGPRRSGALVLVDETGALAGLFTDADLRRLLLERGADAWHERVSRVMTRDPKRLRDDALVQDAVQLVRRDRIDEIPVVDASETPVGLIDVQDLISLKVIEP